MASTRSDQSKMSSSSNSTDPTSHPAYRLLSLAHPPDVASTLFTDKVLNRPFLYAANSLVTAGPEEGPGLVATAGPDSGSNRPGFKSSSRHDDRANRRIQRKKRQADRAKAYKAAGKPQPLTAREKRHLGIHNLDCVEKSEKRWEIYVPLWHLWVRYAREVLAVDPDGDDTTEPKRQHISAQSSGPLICSLDFHGALVEVKRSRCVSRVGLTGIVLRDTKFTFDIITPQNEIKTVPKEYTVFRMYVPLDETPRYVSEAEATLAADENVKAGIQGRSLSFDIHGSRFSNRAADRSTKKTKDVFGNNSKAGGG